MSVSDKITGMHLKHIVNFVAIILASTVFAIILHQFQHDPLMTVESEPRSVVITSGYFPPLAFICLAVSFGIIGLMFLKFQMFLHGTGQYKGVMFGAAVGGMYLVGMFEAYVVYPVPLFGEIYTGFVDSSGIVLMCFLLGKYMVKDAHGGEMQSDSMFSSIAVICVAYVLVRYFSYVILHIDSTYNTRPLVTFLWTVMMGCWIGVMYYMIGTRIWHNNPLKRALAFGGLIFGVNWVLFNLFVLLFISVSVTDLLYRSLFDTAAVTLGVYLMPYFRGKKLAS